MTSKISNKSLNATVALSLLLSPAVFMPKQTSAQVVEPCPSIGEGEKCPAGCWLLESEIDFPFGKRQCSLVGYGYFSQDNDNTRQRCPPGTFSDSINAQVCQQCEAGSYATSEGSRYCQLCPAGMFSGKPGSGFCRPCLDDYYSEDGANAVEYWDGEYYCMYYGSPTASTSPTASPSMTLTEATPVPTTTPSVAPSVERSEEPTRVPTSSPSSAPPSTPFKAGDDGQVISEEDHLIQTMETFSICGDIEGSFEWHGQCNQCPSKVEEGLYPFLIFILFGALITVLQSFLPLCSTSTVWTGIEYLQVLYLISLCGVSWSPMASVVFEKFLPVFALDFSATFSVQCVFGWPKEYDQVFMITLPLLFWLAITALSKFSRERLVAYKSGLRCLTVYLYLGFASLVQTSKDAIDLSAVFSSIFLRLPSTISYAAISGFVGLVFYGLVFPCWFHRAFGRYYKMVVLGIEEEEEGNQDDLEIDDVENQPTCSCLRKITRITDATTDTLFLTLGVFPLVRESASWWPVFWLIRKIAFLVLVAFFPRSPFLLLVALLTILFFSEIFQRCMVPFPNECEEKMGNKWFHSAKVDTVLQVCAVSMVELSLLIVGSEGTRTAAHALTMDVLMLILLSASVIFWLLAVGFAVASSCDDCPRFVTKAKQLTGELTSSKKSEDQPDKNEFISRQQKSPGYPTSGYLEEVPLDDIPLDERFAELPSSVRSQSEKK